MGLPDLYPAQVGSPYTTLAAPYTTGDTTLTVVDATKLPDAPNIVCLAGDVAGEFKYTGKDGNTLTGVTKLSGTPETTWPAGTYAFRGVSAYDHASIVEHLTFQRSHIVEATLDLTANHTYSGRVLEGAEAGEDLAFGDLAVLAESGKFVKANPAALATLDGTIALVVSDTIAAGSQGMFLLRGLIRNDSWTYSQGKELYASNGTLTHEPPTTGTQIIRKVGTALTATIIEFNPSSTLHAEYLVSVLPVNTVSKDNGDVERKFWKDDFSVDSSENYITLSGSASPQSFDTDHLILPMYSGFQIPGGDVIPDKIRLVIGQTGVTSPMTNGQNQLQVRLSGSAEYTTSYNNGDLLFRFFNSGEATNKLAFVIHEGAKDVGTSKTFNTTEDYLAFLNSTWVIEIETLSNGTLKATIPGLSISFTTSWVVKTADRIRPCIIGHSLKSPIEIYEITTSPSISYSDNFTTDTVSGANGRYQAVTGSNAYDDINKRMNVTTATGANGKASGRLKSYKFCEGSQQFDVTLPVGADGDFICMVTHATDPAMTNGIGVGLQSDGAGNWNLATLSGTTVTVGAPSGLTDGKTARIEIEKDITGAYWYYIYDAAGTKPTTATGKLFTTLSEGYTGWYANGAGATTQTYAIENISIRAESIVGRTNVELTEEVFNSVTGQMETRTYFKPIHRGAMLETYFDGTQEVVGTTFVDDCQWDRSAEYPNMTYSAPNGKYTLTPTTGGTIKTSYPTWATALQLGSGYYEFDIDITIAGGGSLPNIWVTNQIRFDKFWVSLFGHYDVNEIALGDASDNWRPKRAYLLTISDGVRYTIGILYDSPTGRVMVYLNGVLIIDRLDAEYAQSVYQGFLTINSSGTVVSMNISRISIIAASSDATNGIAACIPPIGGGARYGVEESVYIPITPGTEIPVGTAVISPNAKSTVVGTALTTFAQTPAGVSASLEYATGTKACPGLSTAFAPAGRHRVKADRNTLTNIGVKGSVDGTSPTVYIDSLHVRKQEVA